MKGHFNRRFKGNVVWFSFINCVGHIIRCLQILMRLLAFISLSLSLSGSWQRHIKEGLYDDCRDFIHSCPSSVASKERKNSQYTHLTESNTEQTKKKRKWDAAYLLLAVVDLQGVEQVVLKVYSWCVAFLLTASSHTSLFLSSQLDNLSRMLRYIQPSLDFLIKSTETKGYLAELWRTVRHRYTRSPGCWVHHFLIKTEPKGYLAELLRTDMGPATIITRPGHGDTRPERSASNF